MDRTTLSSLAALAALSLLALGCIQGSVSQRRASPPGRPDKGRAIPDLDARAPSSVKTATFALG